MINYFVFFFVLIFIVIYIYSLPRKEQFECRQIGHHAITEADKTDKKPCLDIDIMLCQILKRFLTTTI